MIIQDTQRYFQKHKTKTRLKKLFKFLLGAAMFFLIAWVFLLTPLFRVRDYTLTIAHSSAHFAKEADVHQFIEASLDDSKYFVSNRVWYLFGRHALEAAIKKQFPDIGTVKQNWHFFNIISVDAMERTPFVQTCDAAQEVSVPNQPPANNKKGTRAKSKTTPVAPRMQKCILIDSTGVPFKEVLYTDGKSDINNDGLPDVVQFPEIKIKQPAVLTQPLLTKNNFYLMKSVYDFLQQHDLVIGTIVVREEGDVIFETNSGVSFVIALKNNVYQTTRALYMALVEVPHSSKKFKRELITQFDIRDTNVINYTY